MSDADKTPGSFAWNELATSDVKGSVAFYSALFGWEVEEIPGMDDYWMFTVGDNQVAGLLDKTAHCDGPPLWFAYVNVVDVAASLVKAVELGATEMKGVTEVPGMGSFALLVDPQGANIALWQPAGDA